MMFQHKERCGNIRWQDETYRSWLEQILEKIRVGPAGWAAIADKGNRLQSQCFG